MLEEEDAADVTVLNAELMAKTGVVDKTLEECAEGVDDCVIRGLEQTGVVVE